MKKYKIISRYNKSLALIPELVSVCDSINIWDNSSNQAYRIFRKKKDEFTYFHNPAWSKEETVNLVTK